MARSLLAFNHYLTGTVAAANLSGGTAWIRMRPYWQSSDSTDRVIWNLEAAGSSGATSVMLERYLDNNIYAGIIQSGSKRIVIADTAGYFQPARMKAYAFTWDQTSGVQTFYVGTQQIGTGTAAWSAATVDALCVGTFRAGGSPGGANDVEAFALWSKALTAAEIVDLARGTSPHRIRPSARLDYWPITGFHAPEIGLWNGLQLAVNATLPARGDPRPLRDWYDAQAIAAAPGRVLPVVVMQAVQRAANW